MQTNQVQGLSTKLPGYVNVSAGANLPLKRGGNPGLYGGFKMSGDSVHWYIGLNVCLQPGIGWSVTGSTSNPSSGFGIEGSAFAGLGANYDLVGHSFEAGVGSPGSCVGASYTF